MLHLEVSMHKRFTHKCTVGISLLNMVLLFFQDTAGFTPVMLLLLNGHNDIVSDILKDHNPGQLPGLDVQDEKKGWTALMLACEIKSSNVSSLILELGASVDVKDKVCGDSVIHQCIKRSQWGLCKDLVAKTREVSTKYRSSAIQILLHTEVHYFLRPQQHSSLKKHHEFIKKENKLSRLSSLLSASGIVEYGVCFHLVFFAVNAGGCKK